MTAHLARYKMNIANFGKADEKAYTFNINIDFKTKTELTPRMIEVSEAFGLGVSEEKHFVIYKDFNIGFSEGDVVFITGDSGGGKTLLLRKLTEQLYVQKADINTVNLDDIVPNPNDVIIESVGKDLEEAVRLLSMMGLNDAFIFLRKYKELSDGQKYRYRLAKAMSLGVNVVFIDEFCANLDRTTAKVISYNLQRVIRRSGMILIAATTHRDIIDDLQPSVLVDKKFMDEVEVSYKDYEKRGVSFYDDVLVEEGSMADYKKLNKYHYKNTSTKFPYMKITKATYNGDLVGVGVHSPPFLQTKGRTIKFESKYSHMTKPVVAEINKLFIRGARYVISPKYRGCGLGQKLVMDSLPFIKDKKYLEVIAVMGKYNPVFEKCGMEKIEISEEKDPPTIRLTNWMKEKALKLDEIHNPKYFKSFVDGLNPEDRVTLVRMTGKVLHHPKVGLSSKDGRRAEVVAQEQRYAQATFEEVYGEILINLPKIFSGVTLYYILENPHYKEKIHQSLGEYL